MTKETWQTIPQAPGYEFSDRGRVRNIKTGLILKWRTRKRVNAVIHYMTLYVGSAVRKYKYICVTKASLMNYLNGVRSPRQALPVHMTKGGCSWYFPSLNQCAKWLGPKIHYSRSIVAEWLTQRRTEICGYGIIYLDAEDRSVERPTLNKMRKMALAAQKAEAGHEDVQILRQDL